MRQRWIVSKMISFECAMRDEYDILFKKNISYSDKGFFFYGSAKSVFELRRFIAQRYIFKISLIADYDIFYGSQYV